ncbi:POK9 protein, partial [Brachypteracias leptosomus]|nr:POK9 protein [Brachypteracias leptosomus]
RGSLRVEVATAIDIMLTDRAVARIPSSARGPLAIEGDKVGGLLVGRSSSGIRGIIVILGVIDADFTGQIMIMAYTICPPLFIPKGSCIAQIIAIENEQPARQVESLPERGNKGFGSTGPTVCFTTTMNNRPELKLKISMGSQSIVITALLDTGADVTVIS